jgi:hypothetical protein
MAPIRQRHEDERAVQKSIDAGSENEREPLFAAVLALDISDGAGRRREEK